MRILKSKFFDKFARKSQISDEILKKTIEDIENGLIDANLGAGVIKQRIPKQSRGKSKGYRSIIIYKFATLSIFVHGYDKKDQANISSDELLAFKALADDIFTLTQEQLQIAIDNKIFIEVTNNEI
ncbi:type II toxin-antitoxin system RelE/ParE family toxin [Caviibacterium pharyngocola]|uniref:Addiction module toxin RelE n=1 Tax=Caviibacterium pharyngocola TaxID=28159 RepID=A0A2M8RX19_9PAST|nr:type II toxin-antitoxin system RelE/ParE family toxin [Caviibacterium pharyngocola]PJG83438.1 addiction module toxin RelE [Caviibacterium pharyngocola]